MMDRAKLIRIAWRAAVPVAVLFFAVLAWGAAPEGTGVTVFMGILGLVLGAALFRWRPGPLWARFLLVAGVPGLIAIPLSLSLVSRGQWIAPLALLPAATVGAWIHALRERRLGVPRRVLAADWAGAEMVGEAREGGLRFDTRALLAKPPRAEVVAMRRAVPEADDPARRFQFGLFAFVAWVVMPVGLFAMGFGMVQQARSGDGDTVPQLLGMSAILSLMLLAAGILMVFTTAGRSRVTRAADLVRLDRFGRANGMRLVPQRGADRSGLRELSRVLVGRLRRPVLLANSVLTSRTGHDGYPQFSGICEVELAVPLPNIWLRARQDRAPVLSAYTAPARSQILSLEGDFDRYFELYCPAGYERDALYLFTPDVMAWLIDDVGGFDVELIDNRMVLRTRGDLVTFDPADWHRLALALGALDARIVQWERWRDDRVAAEDPAARLVRGVEEPRADGTGAGPATGSASGPVVGAGGQRLRRGIGAGLVFALGYGAIYLLLTALANLR